MTDGSKPKRIVPAVDRAAKLLAILEEGKPMGISELARRIDASKGSVRDVLETLRSHGLLERDDQTKFYSLGAGLVRLGQASSARRDLGAVARPHLTRLANQLSNVVLLVEPQGDVLVILDMAEPESPSNPIAISAHPGRNLPLLAGACGKVVLAHMSPEERTKWLDQLPRHTSRSVVDPDLYTSLLEDVREQRYATDDEEFLEGIRGVAAPVFDHRDQLAAIVLVSALSAAMPVGTLGKIGQAAAAAADELSLSLGAPATTVRELGVEPAGT